MKKLILLLILVNLTGRSQSLLCKASESISTNATGCILINKCLPITNYIPTTNDSTIIIRLNYFFFMPGQNSGKYANVTSADADSITKLINIIWDSLYKPQIRIYPLPAYIWNPKITFQFNKFEKVINANAYYNNTVGNFNTIPDQYKDNATGLNICFIAPSTGPYGYAEAQMLQRGIKVVHDQTSPFNYGTGDATTLSHEFCHSFGLHHVLSPITFPWNLSNDTCITTDYAIVDTATYVNNNWCNNSDSTGTNNLMGGQFNCGKYLSPNQLGVIRYFILNNLKLSTTVVNPNSFENYKVNSSYDTTIYSNITWNFDRFSKGNVIIKNGATLKIQNCDQTFKGGAKIIVEPGARLYVRGSYLKSFSALPWGGIEVWGNYWGNQDTINQGKVNMYGLSAQTGVINAKYGITTGKRFSNTTIDNTTTGGIVELYYATFENNFMDLDFQKYAKWQSFSSQFHQTSLPQLNKSYVKNCQFYGDRTLNGEIKGVCINLFGVYGINFIANTISSNLTSFQQYPNNQEGQAGIYAIDSYFILKGGNIIKNFNFGVVAQNAGYKWPVTIDQNIFHNNRYNDVVIYNTNGSRVTNNLLKTINNNQSSSPCTGLYLFESTNYQVENNTFTAVNPFDISNQVGAYVKNSGPYSNSIYNNTFDYLQQGIYAIGNNWNPTTGQGLKMNCNDFTNSTYNIGVMDLPYATYGVDWTGIDKVQGREDLSDLLKVRNTYGVTDCVGNMENKFYIEANNNDFTNNYFYINRHGSFSNTQFQPIPQAYGSCSNAYELVNLTGNASPPNKSTYCPNNSLPLLAKTALYEQIYFLNDSISAISTLINNRIDKGRKSYLMELIADSEMRPEDLKDTLISAGPYLSDEVLKAYFLKADVPANYIKQV